MTPQVLIHVVTRLYVAAGRRATDVEFEIWQEAFDDLSDEGALEEVIAWVRGVDLSKGAPSPAAFRESLLRRKARMIAERAPRELGAGPATPEARANIDRLRGAMRDVVRRPPNEDDGVRTATAQELRERVDALDAALRERKSEPAEA